MPADTTPDSVRDTTLLFCRGLTVVRVGEQLVVQASGHRHIFRGRSATELLPRLLPLLDGTRTRARIAAELGVPMGHVDRVLDLLRDRSLLDLVPAPADAPVPDHVLDYHARTLDGNGGHIGTGALLDALADVAVRIDGFKALADRVAADLRECGLVRAAAGPVDEAAAAELGHARRALAVVVEHADEPEVAERVATLCGPHGVPVLRVAAYSDSVEIGPRFLPGHAACPACLRQARKDGGRAADAEAGTDPVACELLTGLAGAEILALALGAPTEPAMVVTTTDLTTYTSERHLAVPSAGCPCDDIGGTDLAPDLVDVQLWACVPTAAHALRPGTPTRAFQQNAGDLTEVRPTYYSRPQHWLPTAALPVRGTFGAAPPADLEAAYLDGPVLADLLMRTAGLRHMPGDGPRQRWTPSGGRLGSVELYLATARPAAAFGLPDLPGRLFRYDDFGHALIGLRADDLPLAELLTHTDLQVKNTDAVLVFVAAHDRAAAKYRDFAHRLCHLDAGCAAAQAAAVAEARGLRMRFASIWSDRLSDMLDLVPDRQYVTAVAGIEGGHPCH